MYRPCYGQESLYRPCYGQDRACTGHAMGRTELALASYGQDRACAGHTMGSTELVQAILWAGQSLYRPSYGQDRACTGHTMGRTAAFVAAPDDAFGAGPHVPARMVPARVFGAGPRVWCRPACVLRRNDFRHRRRSRERCGLCRALPYALPCARAFMVPRRREVSSWSRAACMKCGLYAPSPLLDGVMPLPLPEQTMPCP